jgi:hypothetical protein
MELPTVFEWTAASDEVQGAGERLGARIGKGVKGMKINTVSHVLPVVSITKLG